jgi:hypothetical protein
MKYRPRWMLLAIGASVVFLLFTFPYWRKFMTGRTSEAAFAGATEAQKQVFSDIRKARGGDIAGQAYQAILTVVPAPTQEQPPPVLPDAQIVRQGEFIELDALHSAKGNVSIYRSADGSTLLRFDDFAVVNGPVLTIYLSASVAPLTKEDLSSGTGEFTVALLKGTVGNQQYTIPSELNLSRYKSVVLYSPTIEMVYSYATLRGAG